MDGPGLRIAAQHATDRVPTTGPEVRVDELRRALLGQSFDCVDDVAVLDGSELVGIIPIERLLAAEADRPVSDLMDRDPPVVKPGADEEAVAWEMVRRGESSVAVLDGQGTFLGLIPPHRIVRALLAGHDEDVARLGGYLASTARARQAAEESVGRRLWHRLPWLLVGLIGALASAAIVGAFEDELENQVLLAFFIPGVVYLAAAIGTQTQAVLIRGFSVGIAIGDVLRRELISGVMLALAVSVAFVPIALVGWGETEVVVGVAAALFVSSVVATLIAMALPLIFQRFGADPAFGSGPLATVLQDVLTITIYFAVAVPVAG